jgi:lipoprotein-anchoring transpeptidase ErfK/SrfK
VAEAIMSSYYSLLKRAVEKLEPGDTAGRHTVYDRARQALANQLRAPSEGVQAADMAGAMSDLEAAIRDVETEVALQAAPPRAETPVEASETRRIRAIGRIGGSRGNGRWIALAGAGAAVLVLVGLLAYAFRPARSTGAGPQRVAPAEISSSIVQPVDNRSYVLRRQLVYYRSTYPVGTILISKSQNFLYVTKPNTVAVRYSIGMGAEGKESLGLYSVLRKELAPDRAQASPRAADASVARTASPEGDNAAARALFFGEPNYRIHGTDTPSIIGRIVAAGGFQLVGEDIVDLYDRTSVGTRVVVMN